MTALLTYKYICDMCGKVDEFQYKFPNVKNTSVIYGKIETLGAHDVCPTCLAKIGDAIRRLYDEFKGNESCSKTSPS